MRVLGIDFGTVRIGLALSDETATIAQPLEFVPAGPPDAALKRIVEIVQARGVGQVIVGLPRNMNGTYGPAAEAARAFIETLKPAVAVPVKSWDERLTSVQANRMLIEAGLSRRQRKGKVDSSAAAILLQSYLDSESQTHDRL